jgi:hypothetical protein
LARKLVDAEEKVEALRIISEHLISGRWAEVRGPNTNELKATTVLEFTIEEASSKIRTGPPIDEPEDYVYPVWAGVLPLSIQAQTPIPDLQSPSDMALPEYVANYDVRLTHRS